MRSAATIIAVVALAGGCGGGEVRLRDDVYVWQRAWTPNVVAAVRERTSTFDVLHVLAAERGLDGDTVRLSAPSSLRARAVIPVVRVDGSRIVDAAGVAREAADAVARFRAAGIDVRGVELDHDCASSKLPAYAAAIRRVKEAVAPLPVSITALPSWAPSPALDDVIRAADAVVLQVHAVDRPSDGLFSSARARAAIDAFAKHNAWHEKGFFVALPAYGSAVATDGAGDVVGVESEEPRNLGARVREAWAEPKDVAALLRSIERDRPAHLRGVVWFRLPVDGDVRAWSFPTLQAVRAGVVQERVVVEREGVDVYVHNTGTVDAPAPARVDVADSDVVVADGVRGYAWASGAFTSSSPPRVRAGERVAVGWVRHANEVSAHAP